MEKFILDVYKELCDEGCATFDFEGLREYNEYVVKPYREECERLGRPASADVLNVKYKIWAIENRVYHTA